MRGIKKLLLYYLKAPRFYLKGWLWKYLFLELFIFLFVMILFLSTLVLTCGLLVVPWSEKQNLSPLVTQILQSTIRNMQTAYHVSNDSAIKMNLLSQFFSMLAVFLGFVGGLCLQELIVTPWNRKISYRVEKTIIGKVIYGEAPGYAAQVWPKFKRHLIRSPLYLLFILLLIILFGLPWRWLQISLSILAVILACYWAGCYYVGYGLERREIEPTEKKKLLRRSTFTLILFGAFCGGGLWVSSLQLYLLPLWVLIFNPIQIIVGTSLAIRVIDPRNVGMTTKPKIPRPIPKKKK